MKEPTQSHRRIDDPARMETIALYDLAFGEAFKENPALLDEWVSLSHRSRISSATREFLPEFQQIGQLDVLIRSAEREIAIRGSRDGAAALSGFGFNFAVWLSSMWLSLSYEVFRAIQQRAKLPPKDSDTLAVIEDFFPELEMSRVSLFKLEVAQFDKYFEKTEPKPQLWKEDGTHRPYEHRRTVLRPRTQCRPTDGSIAWVVPDAKARGEKTVYRRDLAHNILSALLPSESESIPVKVP